MYSYLKQKFSAVMGKIKKAGKYLKQKFVAAFRWKLFFLSKSFRAILGKIRKTSKRQRVVYLILAVVIAFCFTGLAIFRAKVNRTAMEEFSLATSYYQEAQNATEKKEKLEKFQKAKSLYESILSKFWVKNKGRTCFYLGNCLYSLGEYEEASKVLEKFESKYRNDYFAPWVKIKLASIYEQLQEYEKAVQTYKKILKKYPEHLLASQALLGVARCQKLQGKRDEARKSCEDILLRYPLSEEKKAAEIMIQRLDAGE